MPLLKTILNRASLIDLQRITHSAVTEIICHFDDSPNKASLIEIILQIYSPESILEDATRRGIVLDYIDDAGVDELTQALRIRLDKRGSRIALKEASFNKAYKKILFEYFEIEIETYSDLPSEDVLKPVVVVEPRYGLFPHQEKACFRISSEFSSGSNRILLHMPTGSGKTRTAMNLVCDFIRTNLASRNTKVVIWLAYSEELCDQAAEEFEKSWGALGSGKTNLYRFYGSHELSLADIQSGFVVCSLAKLNRQVTSAQSSIIAIARKTAFVIFDEAHQAVAPTYQALVDILLSATQAKLLGLSATPGRSTYDVEQNRRLAEFFHYKKVSLEVEGYASPIEYLEQEGYIAKRNYHYLPYSPNNLELTPQEINRLANQEIPDSILEKLGIDTLRNIKILTTALEQIELGKKILLFACSVGNAEALFALLRYKKVRAALVTSKTPAVLRRRIIQGYKENAIDILVNYGVLTTGFDAPLTNVALIARPTESLTLYSQMVGRAIRGERAGGNKVCDIFTVADALPGYNNLVQAFEHWDDIWE